MTVFEASYFFWLLSSCAACALAETVSDLGLLDPLRGCDGLEKPSGFEELYFGGLFGLAGFENPSAFGALYFGGLDAVPLDGEVDPEGFEDGALYFGGVKLGADGFEDGALYFGGAEVDPDGFEDGALYFGVELDGDENPEPEGFEDGALYFGAELDGLDELDGLLLWPSSGRAIAKVSNIVRSNFEFICVSFFG